MEHNNSPFKNLEHNNSPFKNIDDYIRMYQDFLLPVVICSTNFTALWFNTEMKNMYPNLIGERCALDLLAEFDIDELSSRLRGGSFRVDGALGFSGVHISLTPVYYEDNVAGVIVMLVSSQCKVGPQDIYMASQTPEAFEEIVRNDIGEIFRSMDAVSVKASMFESGWLQPDLYDIAQNSYHIMRIAMNISAYTSFQSGATALAPHSADIFDILRDAKPMVAGLAEGMGIPLKMNLPERESLVGLDTEKFLFAFLNVLHNSLYFTRLQNRVEITGSVDDNRAEIEIRDYGMGISDAIIKNIFKPYFSSGHDGKPAGIGLGLPVAKKIMEAHGGEISVESALGEGTVVTMTIPRSIFSRRVSLHQGNRRRYDDSINSFSYYYVGLSDAASSPYREPSGKDK